jgi:hypothetical protein
LIYFRRAGDQPAFASEYGEGMDVRTYLIGQALAGVAGMLDSEAKSAATAVRLADEVLKLLDAEARAAAEAKHARAEEERAREEREAAARPKPAEPEPIERDAEIPF